MSRSVYKNESPPTGCICGGLLVVLVCLTLAFVAIMRDERERRIANEAYWKEVQEQYVARNTPPGAASVATVVSGSNVEATGHYHFETIASSGNLSDAQDPLVAWFAAHPDHRLVQVITLTRVANSSGGTSGFIIVTEVRTP